MGKRKLVTGLLLAAGSVAGALFLRYRGAPRQERVDLYFADGTLISLDSASPESQDVLALGSALLRATRPSLP